VRDQLLSPARPPYVVPDLGDPPARPRRRWFCGNGPAKTHRSRTSSRTRYWQRPGRGQGGAIRLQSRPRRLRLNSTTAAPANPSDRLRCRQTDIVDSSGACSAPSPTHGNALPNFVEIGAQSDQFALYMMHEEGKRTLNGLRPARFIPRVQLAEGKEMFGGARFSHKVTAHTDRTRESGCPDGGAAQTGVRRTWRRGLRHGFPATHEGRGAATASWITGAFRHSTSSAPYSRDCSSAIVHRVTLTIARRREGQDEAALNALGDESGPVVQAVGRGRRGAVDRILGRSSSSHRSRVSSGRVVPGAYGAHHTRRQGCQPGADSLVTQP